MTNAQAKNILITGGSGMIGSAVGQHLSNSGYQVYALNRDNTNTPFYYCESRNAVFLDPSIPLYAVINLAGAGLADKRWTAVRKQFVLESRTRLTDALAVALANTEVRPRLLLSASAIGYYGLTGANTVDEQDLPGDDFLAQVASQWERATEPAERAGINTIHLRFGVVLSKRGGMLKQLLLPFRLGLGGRIGNGRQYLSWISIVDVVEIIHSLIRTNPRSGPLNLVADQPVTNAEFSKQLAATLHRPNFLPFPAVVARLLFGEMADALLLGSSRVQSVRLKALGIQLQHPTLELAIKALLDTPK